MNPTEQILTKVLNCRRIDLYTREKDMNDRQRAIVAKMMERFEKGEPLQYILEEVTFCDVELHVNQDVLIPRFETEILAERMIAKLQRIENISILDLGTGSGNIAIALAKVLPGARILAVDISKKAIELAEKNAKRNKVEDQIAFVCEDMHVFLKDFSGQIPPFDCVVSNPPYISTKELACLPRDVRQEPITALDGGIDGCLFYHVIVKHLRSWLKTGGYCFFEIGQTQAEQITHIFQTHPVSWKVNVFQDYTQVDRIIEAQWIN